MSGLGPIGLAVILEACWSVARADLGWLDDRDGRQGIILATQTLGVETMAAAMRNRMDTDPALLFKIGRVLRAQHQALTS